MQSITDRQTADAQSIFSCLIHIPGNVTMYRYILCLMLWNSIFHVPNLFWELKNFWSVLIACVGSYNIILFFWRVLTFAECNSGTTQKLCGVNSRVVFQNMTTASDNTGTLVSWNVPRWMPLLMDGVILSSSIIVLTPNVQFCGCATIAFSERYVLKISNLSLQKCGKRVQTITKVCRTAYTCISHDAFSWI
jgi:hypothetical protein